MVDFVYPAKFVREPEGGYTVEFVDFKGATYGETLTEAFYMAWDFLGLSLLGYKEEGLDIPDPSSLEDIKVEEGSFVNYVALDYEAYLRNTEEVA